jgi:integrase/recombinase XerD
VDILTEEPAHPGSYGPRWDENLRALGLRAKDVDGCKVILKAPKGGKEAEVVFITQKVANRLRKWIENRKMEADQRVFPLTYQSTRAMVKKAGNMVGIRMAPHDLRRHAAVYAPRSGAPIEINE